MDVDAAGVHVRELQRGIEHLCGLQCAWRSGRRRLERSRAKARQDRMRRAFDHHLAGEEVGVEVDDSHWALDSVKHLGVL